jgi:hypothetical protein
MARAREPDRICMPSPCDQVKTVARAREPDRICMPSPCNLAKLVERACGPDRICMPSTTTRVKILAGPSGEDRICMPSPTKKINLVCTGRVLPKTIKLGLNKRQPQGVPSTARQRVQTLHSKVPRTPKMSCTHNMTRDLNT